DDSVHRLEQMRGCSGKRLAHGDAPGGAEGELRGIDGVVAAVDQSDADIDHREAAQRAFLQRVLHALLDGRDILPGNRAAVDFLVELKAFAAAQGPDFDDDVAELAVAARLLLVAAVLPDRAADTLAIADRTGLRADDDAVAALEPGDDQVQMLVVDSA